MYQNTFVLKNQFQTCSFDDFPVSVTPICDRYLFLQAPVVVLPSRRVRRPEIEVAVGYRPLSVVVGAIPGGGILYKLSLN